AACTDCIYNYFSSETDAENFTDEGLIAIPDSFKWTSNANTVYVRIDSQDKCYQISEISIVFQESPIIPLADTIGLCENEDDVTIDAGFGFDSYLWSTNETTQTIIISANNIGDHSVTVTQDYGTYVCSSTKDFTVSLSNTAIIDSIDIEDWTDNNNVITINLSNLSLGDYEYSLDDITYQDSAIFTNLNYGEQTVYIRDKNGCGTISESVYLLNAPKFFTPNNDGYNDTWSIPFSETVEPTMTINIYDRYGKLIKYLNASAAWDGTCSGKDMPTTDYWYVVTRQNGRHYTGHFTLKR
ncbi:T9SS type B sorting domain-containing protein, partial [Algibacter sp.]|nr:T9SS type B sorting domain-containing protein [Algibacter sp.]